MKHIQNYLFAGLITVVMFVTAFTLSDELRERQAIDLSSIRTNLSLTLMDQDVHSDLLSVTSCDVDFSLERELDELGERISVLESQHGWENEQVQRLKKEHALLQIRDYLVVLDRNERCNDEVEYFVAFVQHDGCDACEQVWRGLWQFGELVPESRAYIFDIDLGLASVGGLRMSLLKEVGIVPGLVRNGAPYTLEELTELIEKTKVSLETEEATLTQE